jgi:hypothetical protein
MPATILPIWSVLFCALIPDYLQGNYFLVVDGLAVADGFIFIQIQESLLQLDLNGKKFNPLIDGQALFGYLGNIGSMI